jgi:protein-disulfide isomerase
MTSITMKGSTSPRLEFVTQVLHLAGRHGLTPRCGKVNLSGTCMLRVLSLACLLATPALALDPSAMTDAEREAFRAEVRAYLLDHPEVLMEAIGVLENRRADEQASADAALLVENREAIFQDAASWVGGNPDGDITIVEFLDYKCGYCKQAHPEVMKLLGDDGNIRYVVKEFPILGDQSLLAARFAIAVLRVSGDEAYEQVHDEMMRFRGEISEASLRSLADRLSLDTDQVMAAMSDPDVDAVIAANHQLAQRLGINGTPGFILGDQLVRGYVSYDAMAQVIAEGRG